MNDLTKQDICGLCGLPGADKYAHPMHWPGERVPMHYPVKAFMLHGDKYDRGWLPAPTWEEYFDPNGALVHAKCEQAECSRAHAALTDKQRNDFLRSI